MKILPKHLRKIFVFPILFFLANSTFTYNAYASTQGDSNDGEESQEIALNGGFSETQEEEDENAEEEKAEIVPSRSVTLTIGESTDISYPGRNWIFLGAIDDSKNIASAMRKTGDADTTFELHAKETGTSILHFYKEDILESSYIDDYISVTIENANDSVPIDLQESTMPPAQTLAEFHLENNNTEQQREIQIAPYIPIEQMLEKAKESFASKNYQEAFDYVEQFLSAAEKNRDEALFILGQLYESNSNLRNIKKAIAAYENLMDNYKGSDFWDDANKRVIYLKRFYINIM